MVAWEGVFSLSQGLPGIAFIKRKVIQVTKKIVTIAIPSLFAKYLPILSHLNILSVLYIAVAPIKTFVFVESTYFG